MSKALSFNPGDTVYVKQKYGPIIVATVVSEFEEPPRWGQVKGTKKVRVKMEDGREFAVRKSRQFIMTETEGAAFFAAQREAEKRREARIEEEKQRVTREAAAFAKTAGGKKALALIKRVEGVRFYHRTVSKNHPSDEVVFTLRDLAKALTTTKEKK